MLIRLSRRALRGAGLALFLSAALPAASRAQTAAPVAEAARLRDARDFRGAAAVLERHLAAHPEDVSAARMLAQTLYWMGDRKGAAARYEAALTRFPRDERLRLDYARMLAETGRGSRAREVLSGTGGAEAEVILGTLAYWEGDLTAARARLRRARTLDAGNAEAARILDEIAAAASSWVRLSAGVRTDDQPLDRAALVSEAGWHATPLRAVAVRVEPQRYAAPEGLDVLAAEAALRDYWPALRTEVEAAAGVLQRGGAAAGEWTGRLALGVRLPRGAALRGRVERAPYFWTVASLSEPVVTESASGALAWSDPTGWMGEAGSAVQRFPDANRVRSAHAWLLAPLVRGPGARIGAGYAFGAQDADESRFVPARGGDRSGGGRYEPYYTPEQVLVHSAIGSLSVPAGAVRFDANGSYGFRATEMAPGAGTAGARVSFAERSFHPWSARAALALALSRGVSLSVEGEHARTAFYAATSVGAGLTWRFLPQRAPTK